MDSPAHVIVLGMHRSGTSVITHLVHLMGCHVGSEDELLPPDDGNPRGYWERKDVVGLNDDLLRSLGADWRRLGSLDLGNLDARREKTFSRRARKILERLEPHRPWVLKDPRMCLLLPWWLELLDRPICVWLYRSPLEVAMSVYHRNRLPVPFGIALWEKQNLGILEHTRGLPRILISYHELMKQPAATVSRLRSEIRHAGLELRRLAEREIWAVVDPDLHHHHSSTKRERGYLNPAQVKLTKALKSRKVLELDPTPALSQGSLDLLLDYETTDSQVRELEQTLKQERRHYAEELQLRDGVVAEGEKARQEILASASELRKRLAETEADLKAERGAHRRAENDFQTTQQTLVEERALHTEELRTRDHALDEAETMREELLASIDQFQERLAEIEKDLEDHRQAYRRADSDFRTAEQTLVEERARFTEQLGVRDRALAEAEKLRDELLTSIDQFQERLAETEGYLEEHRDAYRRVEDDFQITQQNLVKERSRFVEQIRERDQALAGAEKLRDELLTAIDQYQQRLTETEKDLDNHRQACRRAEGDHQAIHQTLLEERKHFAEGLRECDQALAEAEKLRQDLLSSIEHFQRRRLETEEDLENHRLACRRAKGDCQTAQQTLADEQDRFADELRERDQALAGAEKLRDELLTSIDQYQQRLAEAEEDARGHRKAHERAALDFRKTEQALIEERELHARALLDRDRSLADREEELARVVEEHQAATGKLTRTRALIQDLEHNVAQLEVRLAELEELSNRLSRENRLALPLVLPARMLLRIWDKLRKERP